MNKVMIILYFADHEYINLITYKKDDTSVKTPVWVAEHEDYLVITSSKSAGKVKRIRNFSSVKVAICNFKGDLRGDWVSAQAELIDEEDSITRAYGQFQRKYSLSLKVINFFSRLFGKYKKRQIIKFNLSRCC